MSQVPEINPPQGNGPREKVYFECVLSGWIEYDVEYLNMIMSEDWARVFYSFKDKHEAIAHLIDLLNRFDSLSNLDGHCGCPDNVAQLSNTDFRAVDPENWEFKKVKPKEES